MNHGIVLSELLRHDEAIARFEQALSIDPTLAGAHFGMAEALLARGDLARGWEEYEWRFRLDGAAQPIPPNTGTPWDGLPLAGTLLLVADQGFGDAIQFGRYIPWAAARCHEIVLACSAELAPIMATLHPSLRVVTEWGRAGRFAAWCPLTGLPRLAGTTIETIPGDTPYLRAEPARVAHWAARLDGLVARRMRRVGIVWAGRPAHKNDRKRSMRLADLAPIADLADVALIVLQKGPSQSQVGSHYGRAPLIHLSAEVDDFRDTMAIIDNLDVVVTVDTSVAHLAGAMARPVWIMLPWSAEWRWMLGRSDSPWYPSARLFRQRNAGAWDTVASDIALALAQMPRVAR